MKEKTVQIKKIGASDEEVYYSCTLTIKHTIKSFILETIHTSKYVSYRIKEKRKKEVCINCYGSADGIIMYHMAFIDVNKTVKKAEASEFNGHYWFSINI